MKPKYYSCFFLSLFACDQGKIEVNNEKAQDVDPKGNLLNVDSSIIDVVNNLCEGVKDINDKNDPAYVELTTKLVEEYANSFWSLERCQGIVKQICEQVPSYPSQIVYDVLYALLKSKCLGAADVRTIIQGIKEDNPKVFSLLNNYVCLNRSRVIETDEPARIMAESFGFIFNDTISIPGINILTSTPLPSPETKITVDRLTNIWHCVNFIKSNGFNQESVKQLINLVSSGDFNEAIKAIADAKIFFKGSGDEMMEVFKEKNVNLNDEGLQALADCISKGNKISTTENLKKIIPSLRNCTDLKPIFNKCANGVKVDEDFLQRLKDNCPENYFDLVDSIPNLENKEAIIGEEIDQMAKNKKLNINILEKICKKFRGIFSKSTQVTKLIVNSDLDKVESLDNVIATLKNGEFNLNLLQSLISQCNNDSKKFNKIISKISDDKFKVNASGTKVVNKFFGKNIKLDNDNLTKILSMIGDTSKISNYQTAINFCCKNIQSFNETNIKEVFKKVQDKTQFGLKDLKNLLNQGQDKFDQILPCIPDGKLQKCKTEDIVKALTNSKIQLKATTLPKVLAMTNDEKIILENFSMAIQCCCKNIANLDKESFDKIINLFNNFKFNEACLKELITQCRNDTEKLNKILSLIYYDYPNNITVKNIKGDNIINTIKDVTGMSKENIAHILSMIDKKQKISADNNTKVFKFCCNNEFGEKDIDNIIGKCKNFKFTLSCLDLYTQDNHARFYNVLKNIPDKNFDNSNDGNNVVRKIQDLITNKEMRFDSDGNLKKILNLCQKGVRITDVDALYPVFCRSCNNKDDVDALSNLVQDNSLKGNNFIEKIDNNVTKAKAQKAFVKEFYNKIQLQTISCSNTDEAGKFMLFTYILYKEGGNLESIRDKMNNDQKDTTSNNIKIFMQKSEFYNKVKKFYDEDISDFDNFKMAWKTAFGVRNK